MTALLAIIGGVAGGGLGWLMDRRRQRTQEEADTKPGAACETAT
jgi:hypothetical protein